MANHYNLVNHFLEIGVNASVQFQSHGSNAGIDRCYTLGNGCGERTKGRVTFNEPQNKFVGCSPDGVSISKTIDFTARVKFWTSHFEGFVDKITFVGNRNTHINLCNNRFFFPSLIERFHIVPHHT